MNTYFAKLTEYLRRAPGESREQLAPTEGGAAAVSVPLYVAGAIAQIAGLAAVSYQLGESSFAYFTIALTVIGMAVSFQLRRIGTHPRLIKSGTLLLGLVFLYALRGAGFFGQIVPAEAQGSQEMLLVSALAFTATFCSFILLTDDAVVFTCVWAIAMIGLTGTVNINRELVICFIVFLLAAAFLLVHANALAQSGAGTPRPRRSGPPSPGERPDLPLRSRTNLLRTQAVMAGVAWAASLLLGFLIAIPVQMVGRNLSLGTIIQRLRVPPSAVSRSPGLPRLAFDNLGQFNVGLGPVEDDPTERMVVLSDKPRYWRGRVYDQYNGRGWISTIQIRGEELYPTAGSNPGETGMNEFKLRDYAPPRARKERQTFHYQVINGLIGPGPLYHAAEPVAVRAPVDRIVQRTDNTIGSGRGVGDEYEVVSEVVEPKNADLRASGTRYPEEIVAQYLTPGTSNDALMQLMQEALAGSVGANPFDRAQAIRRFVASRCMYTRDARAVPQGRDAAEFFLNESKEGYCDLYATSMAVLCRYAGIPARVATGFAPGTETDQYGGRRDPKDKRKAYLLRGSDLHAWAEVYFVGYGWVPFDATIDTGGTYTAPRTPEPVKKENRWQRLLQTARVPLALTALGVIGLLYVLVNELAARFAGGRGVSRRARGGNPGAAEVAALYLQASRRVGKKAGPRPSNMTPGEYVRRVRGEFDPAVADALGALTGLAERALYGPETVTPADVTAARSAAAAVKDALARYRPAKEKADAVP